MGCGIADFGRRGLKTPQTQFLGVLSLPPGTRSAGDLDSQRHGKLNLKPPKIEFGAFLGPSSQNQLYHTPFIFKIWDLTKNRKIVNDPFKRVPIDIFVSLTITSICLLACDCAWAVFVCICCVCTYLVGADICSKMFNFQIWFQRKKETIVKQKRLGPIIQQII